MHFLHCLLWRRRGISTTALMLLLRPHISDPSSKHTQVPFCKHTRPLLCSVSYSNTSIAYKPNQTSTIINIRLSAWKEFPATFYLNSQPLTPCQNVVYVAWLKKIEMIVLKLLWCPIKMRAACLLSPSFITLGSMGASKAALILMKNSHLDWTL